MTRAVTLAEIADTNTFIVDGTNNRVGIASTIPTVTLDVDGVVKATSFTGSITGSASGLTGTPDIAVGNITGVAATFTGVLTYEDVTNIDSIGIITARSGVKVPDSQKIFLGTGDDIEIFHNGTSGRITNSDGSFFVGADRLKLTNGAVSEVFVDCIANGRVDLFYDASVKLTTASDGVEVTGKLTFAGDGVSNGIELGADADLLLYHDNTDAYFDNNKGDFYIRNSGSNSNQVYISGKGGENGIIVNGDGSVELYHDNSKKLETSATGVTVTGTLNATTDVQINGKGAATTGKAIAMAMVFG